MSMRLSRSIAVALGVVSASSLTAHAQDTAPAQAKPDAPAAENESNELPPSGLAAGGFRFFPQVTVTTLYDTNISGVNGSVPVDKLDDPRGPIGRP